MASASTSGSPTIEAASAVPGVAPTPPAVPGTAAQAARDDDILILSAARTPIGKAKRGSFRDLTPDLLLRPVLQAVMERCPGLPREEIADVVIGKLLARASLHFGLRLRTQQHRSYAPSLFDFACRKCPGPG